MQTLTAQQYAALKQDATPLEADALGEKVLHLRDNTIIKLFRRKRLFSSALFIPYSKRFANNAYRLEALGFLTVSILELWRIPTIRRTAVHYKPLEGETLRKNLPNMTAESRKVLIPHISQLIARLHEKGVYFRSLHAGNIVQTPKGELGLIDISDMQFYGKPLSLDLRHRNFEHFTRYKEDIALFSESDIQQLISLYRKTAGKLAPQRDKLEKLFQLTY